MYIFVACFILAMIALVLFLADSLWNTQSNMHQRTYKLERLTAAADKTKFLLVNSDRSLGLMERRLQRNTYVVLGADVENFNAILANPDWITKLYLMDADATRQIQLFQTQLQQMSQYISLILKADTEVALNSAKSGLLQQLQQNFFKDAQTLQARDQKNIEILKKNITAFAWMILPCVALILFAIWSLMIAPMIARQYRNYNELKQAKTNALEAAEQAQRANAAKSRFLTVLSHEFRTPLNAIIGVSEQLVTVSKTKVQKNYAGAVLKNGQDLTVLVNALIDLSDANNIDTFDVDQFMQTVQESQKTKRDENLNSTFALAPQTRVLIADDNKTNRMVLSRLVKRLGAQAMIVEDGQKAVQAYLKSPFDLLLLDIDMPIKRGDEAIKDIRNFEADQNLPRAPAVAVTANTLVDQLNQYQTAGFDRCLPKPVSFAALDQTLSQVMLDRCTNQA